MSVDHVIEIKCDHHMCEERVRFLTAEPDVARDSAVKRKGWATRGKLDLCPYHTPTQYVGPLQEDDGLRDLPIPGGFNPT